MPGEKRKSVSAFCDRHKRDLIMMISDQELFQIAYPYIKQKKHVLLSIGIVDPSETRKICIGEAGISQVKNDCTYEIGSITKSFVASLIADLVEKERISLSDVVWKGATLKQLLTHSSAIEEYPIHNVDFPNPFSNIFTEDIKRFLEKRDLSSKHGWSYSNLGFALIGMFLEEKLNSSFAEIIEKYIKQNLKLSNTYIGYNGADLLGHSATDSIAWRWNQYSAFLPAGCLVSNVDDMLEYLKLHMTEPSYAMCHETHLKTELPFDMGLAFMKQKKDGIIFCSGLTPGFSSVVCFDSAKRFGAVVLSNYHGFGYGDPHTPMGIGFRILNTISKTTVHER